MFVTGMMPATTGTVDSFFSDTVQVIIKDIIVKEHLGRHKITARFHFFFQMPDIHRLVDLIPHVPPIAAAPSAQLRAGLTDLADQLGCVLIIFFLPCRLSEYRREVPGHSQFRVPESRAGHCAPSHGRGRRRSRCDSAGTWQVLWISDAIWTVYWLVPPPAP